MFFIIEQKLSAYPSGCVDMNYARVPAKFLTFLILYN